MQEHGIVQRCFTEAKDLIDEAITLMQQAGEQSLEAIAKAFNSYFKTDLEVDHAQSLMGDNPGRHHPDNLQLISKTHNRIKSKKTGNE